MYRRLLRIHLHIGIPNFELKTPNNRNIIQGELMKFMEVPEEMHHDTWIDRQLKFYEKLDRMFLRWEIKKGLKQNQLNFDETLDASEPTLAQMSMAHSWNTLARERNGLRAHRSAIVWEDEASPGTMFYAETCSYPRPQFWWLPRLSLGDRAKIDHHIASEIERGEWD